MDRKQLKRERVVSSVGLFFVSIAFVATFFYAPNEKFIFHSICPSNVVARIVHAISVIGAIFHVIGQIVIAMIFLGTGYVIFYLPLIGISAIITGVLVGITAKLVINTGVIKKLRERHNF